MKQNASSLSAALSYAHQDHALTDSSGNDVRSSSGNSGHGKRSRRFEADEELQQRVLLFLTGSNLPALRHLKVNVDGDTVTLRGQVQTFYEKQLAVEFSKRVAGVIRVVDAIDVRGYAPRLDVARKDPWRPDRTRLSG